MAHAVDLLVDRGFLLDIGVRARDIGFRLVIIVIGYEIFHRIVGEEALEFPVKLRRQRLVGREHDGRALQFLDHLGHGKGLARAGDAEQHLVLLVRPRLGGEFRDGLRLVAGGLELALHLEADAAFALFRARRAVGRPGLARHFGPPSSIRRESAATVAEAPADAKPPTSPASRPREAASWGSRVWTGAGSK